MTCSIPVIEITRSTTGAVPELKDGTPPAILGCRVDRAERADHGRIDERRVAEVEDEVLLGRKSLEARGP